MTDLGPSPRRGRPRNTPMQDAVTLSIREARSARNELLKLINTLPFTIPRNEAMVSLNKALCWLEEAREELKTNVSYFDQEFPAHL